MMRLYVLTFSVAFVVVIHGLPEHYKEKSVVPKKHADPDSSSKHCGPSISLVLSINTNAEESGCCKEKVHSIQMNPNNKHPTYKIRCKKNCTVGEHLTKTLFEYGDIIKTSIEDDDHRHYDIPVEDDESDKCSNEEVLDTTTVPPKTTRTKSNKKTNVAKNHRKYSKAKLVQLIEKIYNKTKQLDISDSECEDDSLSYLDTSVECDQNVITVTAPTKTLIKKPRKYHKKVPDLQKELDTIYNIIERYTTKKTPTTKADSEENESEVLSEDDVDPTDILPISTRLSDVNDDAKTADEPASAPNLKPFRRSRKGSTKTAAATSKQQRTKRQNEFDLWEQLLAAVSDDTTDESDEGREYIGHSNDQDNTESGNPTNKSENTSANQGDSSAINDNASADTDNTSADANTSADTNTSTDINTSTAVESISTEFSGEPHPEEFIYFDDNLPSGEINPNNDIDEFAASRITRASKSAVASTSRNNRTPAIRNSLPIKSSSKDSKMRAVSMQTHRQGLSAKDYLQEKAILDRLTGDDSYFVDSSEAHKFYDLYNKFSKKMKVIFSELSGNKLQKSNNIKKSADKEMPLNEIDEKIESVEKQGDDKQVSSEGDEENENDTGEESNDKAKEAPQKFSGTINSTARDFDSEKVLGGKTIVFGKDGPKMPLTFTKDTLGRLHVILDGSCLCPNCKVIK